MEKNFIKCPVNAPEFTDVGHPVCNYHFSGVSEIKNRKQRKNVFSDKTKQENKN